jgi:hypothetical protein
MASLYSDRDDETESGESVVGEDGKNADTGEENKVDEDDTVDDGEEGTSVSSSKVIKVEDAVNICESAVGKPERQSKSPWQVKSLCVISKQSHYDI